MTISVALRKWYEGVFYINMNKKSDAKGRLNFFLNILQTEMKICQIRLGWDLENKKLVLQDVETELLTRVDLTELNQNIEP